MRGDERRSRSRRRRPSRPAPMLVDLSWRAVRRLAKGHPSPRTGWRSNSRCSPTPEGPRAGAPSAHGSPRRVIRGTAPIALRSVATYTSRACSPRASSHVHVAATAWPPPATTPEDPCTQSSRPAGSSTASRSARSSRSSSSTLSPARTSPWSASCSSPTATTAAIGRPVVADAAVRRRSSAGAAAKGHLVQVPTKGATPGQEGHRQELTVLRITDITFNGKSAAKVRKAETEARSERQRARGGRRRAGRRGRRPRREARSATVEGYREEVGATVRREAGRVEA